VAKSRLDLTSKIYQSSMWPLVRKVGRGEVLDGPLVVDLDPTTFCDLACPECISGRLLNQSRFSKERLAELAKEFVAAGVRAVVLIGGGEPLAHPGTRDVIRILGEQGVAVGVVTNGTMINQQLDELAEYAAWVRVSVDAGSTETSAVFRPNKRGGSEFDKVIENMRSFAAVKRGQLGYSFLIMTREASNGTPDVSNHHDVLRAATLAKDIGCDYFELKTMFDDDHFVVRMPEKILEEIRAQLDAASELEDETFEIVYSSTFTSIDSGASSIQAKEYQSCPVAELRTLVTPSGMYVCSYHRGNPAALLGDPVAKSFQKIWRESPRAIINPQRDCAFHCARHASNLAIRASSGAEEVELVADFDPFI
jgi:MoaA/NifB/PqqE/SkfB family radical SAM enzyme